MKETQERQIIPEDDEIDLVGLLAALWRRRLPIVFGTLLLTLLAGVYTLTLPRLYRSTGFIGLQDVSRQAYMKQEDRIIKNKAFLDLARWSGEFTDTEIAGLEKILNDSKIIRDAITPEQAFTDEQIRRIPGEHWQEANQVVGLSLGWSERDPRTAARMVAFLARHIRDALIYEQIRDYLLKGEHDSRQAISELENQAISANFSLQRQEARLSDLKRISRSYPSASEISGSQVVTGLDGGERFLPLIVQRVGLEVAISEAKQKLTDLDRSLEMNGLRLEFFSRACRRMNELPELGEPLLQMISALNEDLFSERDQSLASARFVSNEIKQRIQALDFTLKKSHRFLSGPNVPKSTFKPKIKKTVIRAFFIAFLLMLIAGLLLNWWENQGPRILAKRAEPEKKKPGNG